MGGKVNNNCCQKIRLRYSRSCSRAFSLWSDPITGYLQGTRTSIILGILTILVYTRQILAVVWCVTVPNRGELITGTSSLRDHNSPHIFARGET